MLNQKLSTRTVIYIIDVILVYWIWNIKYIGDELMFYLGYVQFGIFLTIFVGFLNVVNQPIIKIDLFMTRVLVIIPFLILNTVIYYNVQQLFLKIVFFLISYVSLLFLRKYMFDNNVISKIRLIIKK